VTVWTISADAGTQGAEIARELAEAARVPMLDRATLLPLAADAGVDLPDADQIEERFGGRIGLIALGLAASAGSFEACRELQLREALPELGRTVLHRAARSPAVIYAPAAFAPLQDWPGAVHARIRAPFAWRVEALARRELIDRHVAGKRIRHDDHLKRHWVQSLYHADPDDPRWFTVVLDGSRLSTDQIVATLLTIAGVERAA
jgi:hypothetical protein